MGIPSRRNLEQRIQRIDRLLMQLSAREINPLRVLAASVVAHDRREKRVSSKKGRAST
jgi:hypothetical protein